MPTLDYPAAQDWLRRWDTQQEQYILDREERFQVIIDLVRHHLGDRKDPVIVDLGCGPGSLSGRLAKALPGARIIGVDADPLLLGLGSAYYGQDYPRVEFVDADLADPNWVSSAGLTGRIDAAVSTTALHWMAPESLAGLYRTLGELLEPNGIFVNGDHLPTGTERLDQLSEVVRNGQADRAGGADLESWRTWWREVLEDECLGPLVDARSQRALEHDDTNNLSVDQHTALLHEAGFTEVGAVWQQGEDRVLVALR
ncbi:methyltransferase family protein [Tamaricihabitans halophyticus]|uniref:Methyltransferase family protein n=1 Tax=Tamaricihabitans halophyticus TaxID=1262583 RepID=A0A4R2QY60_9PSEU|nr:class I SAM-dependent methyltransferase [Tamaricihabitans halophyticus]TCP55140.1 methyltransferase family protein [Tamaricihabitans halophyticus]